MTELAPFIELTHVVQTRSRVGNGATTSAKRKAYVRVDRIEALVQHDEGDRTVVQLIDREPVLVDHRVDEVFDRMSAAVRAAMGAAE